MKERAGLIRSFRPTVVSREQRLAVLGAMAWIVLSAGFVGFMLFLTAVQHG